MRERRLRAMKKDAPPSPVPEAERPYAVPANWRWVRLVGGFAECLDNFRKPVNATERARREGDIPYYGATGQVGWIDDYLTDEHLVLLGEDGAPFLDLMKDKAYIIEGKAWVNNHAHILRSFFGSIGNHYLVHYLNNFDYKGYVNGTTRLKLTQANMSAIPIPLPPLPEQRRIVERIESLFSKLDEARAKVQAVLDGAEARRAAILHRAFTGELTARWRAERGLGMEGWREKKFSDLGQTKLGKMLDSAKNTGAETLYLRNANVRWFDFDLDDIGVMLASEKDRANLSINNGDLLICEGGEPGRCAVWTGGDNAYIFQKALHRFRPVNDVSSQFIAFYLYYFNANGALQEYFTGTTIKHLTGKSLANVPVRIPPLHEQNEIVRILDGLLSHERRVHDAASAMVERIDLIKKAVLARAFRGELGTNDPTEASDAALQRSICFKAERVNRSS